MPEVSQSILLHICCGPCSIMPSLRLLEAGFTPVLWFMNPNIQPLSEYFRRREAALECARRLDLPILIDDGSWDIARWVREQIGRVDSPERCEWCCASRLVAARCKAAELGFPYYSTSLLYSRYQPHEAIRVKGLELDEREGPAFYYQDFRKDWQAGIDRSIEWGIYRQPYCGCVFSEAERYAKKLARLARESSREQQPDSTSSSCG